MTNLFDKERSTSDTFLFLPSRAGAAALREFQRRNTTPFRVRWGERNLDNYLVPMVPGDLAALIARPGMGKTSAAIHLARAANQQLVDCGDENGYVVYITWETLVEEFVAILNAKRSQVSLKDIGRGNADLSRLEEAIAASIDERIAVVGMSVADQDERRRDRRMPTLTEVDSVLWEMREMGIIPSLLILDYLQRIPASDPRKDRSAAVSENLERIKDLGLTHRVPVVLGVQAKREVDDYKGLQLAGMSDGQWTSNIEQTCDKVISLTRPSLYMKDGDPIEDTRIDTSNGGYTVGPQTFVMHVVKQRWAEAGQAFVVNLDPAASLITSATPNEVVY